MLPIEKMLISFISDSYQLISAQVRTCMEWEPVWREKMANFHGMCSLFRLNCILRIEIEQMEHKLNTN